MGKSLYFEVVCGAAGDMILASLIDLGVPLDYLNANFEKLSIEGLELGVTKVNRSGIMCTHLQPTWTTQKSYRHYEDIRDLIVGASFPQRVVERSISVLDTIARAESEVHGIPLDHVHFHEIGAVDTILDIVGVALALEYLQVDELYYSTLTVGYGFIQGAHGQLPVPVPATTKIIKGLKVKSLDIPTEILTPTGAALLVTLGQQRDGCPEGMLSGTGYGCGTKVFEHRPNILRVQYVQTQQDAGSSGDEVEVIESDMDHISGELMGHVSGLLFDAGALDVSWIPLYMKKNRPGYRISVIAPVALHDSMIDIIMFSTRTLGVRFTKMQRIIAQRAATGLSTDFGTIDAKLCSYKGHEFTKPEYEALARLSRERDIPLPELIDRIAGVAKKQ